MRGRIAIIALLVVGLLTAQAAEPVLRRIVRPNRVPLPERADFEDYSWTLREAPLPREFKVHDIVSVIVNEKAELTGDGRYNRQRQGNYKAELKEFIRLDDDLNLVPSAANQPTVEGTLQSSLQSRGQLTSSEGIRYRISASIVDLLPNGYLVLEARKTIRSDNDVWHYTLTGICRPEDVGANNTITSENIASVQIERKERGRLRESTRRGWLLSIYDFLAPF